MFLFEIVVVKNTMLDGGIVIDFPIVLFWTYMGERGPSIDKNRMYIEFKVQISWALLSRFMLDI